MKVIDIEVIKEIIKFINMYEPIRIVLYRRERCCQVTSRAEMMTFTDFLIAATKKSNRNFVGSLEIIEFSSDLELLNYVL